MKLVQEINCSIAISVQEMTENGFFNLLKYTSLK